MPALSRADLELVELLDTAPSISAIARELGRTQPAVSTRLAALERRHGGPLVARYAHGITPESPALELARLARRALLAIDAAEDRLTGFDVAAGRERTTVAASLTIAEHLLSGWLSSVPGSADVDIVVANSLDVVRNVRAGSAHIGFIEGAHAPTDLVSWEIGHDELAVVAPASHRGGRLTGTDLLALDKQIDLIKQVVPNAKRIGIVYNPGEANSVVVVKEMQKLLPTLGMTLVEAAAPRSVDVGSAARSLIGKVDVIYTNTDNNVVSAYESLVKVGQDAKIPLIASDTDSVKRGAIAAYGINYRDLGEQTGRMVVRILKGEKPGDIKPEVSTKIELFVNPAAAEKQGVKLSDALVKSAATVVK